MVEWRHLELLHPADSSVLFLQQPCPVNSFVFFLPGKRSGHQQVSWRGISQLSELGGENCSA